jgi:hypothetical protein
MGPVCAGDYSVRESKQASRARRRSNLIYLTLVHVSFSWLGFLASYLLAFPFCDSVLCNFEA